MDDEESQVFFYLEEDATGVMDNEESQVFFYLEEEAIGVIDDEESQVLKGLFLRSVSIFLCMFSSSFYQNKTLKTLNYLFSFGGIEKY
jgi:hypothetical protein